MFLPQPKQDKQQNMLLENRLEYIFNSRFFSINDTIPCKNVTWAKRLTGNAQATQEDAGKLHHESLFIANFSLYH